MSALIATGIPFMGHGDFAQWSRIFGAVAPEVAGIRRFGAASLDLAWVAAGRFDGYWESNLQALGCRRRHACWCAKRAVSSPISGAETRDGAIRIPCRQ